MPQVKTGTVISNKMQKVVVVKIETLVKHPFYKKRIKRSKNIKAQDTVGTNLGDKVKIAETKPMSKDVNFKVVEVLK